MGVVMMNPALRDPDLRAQVRDSLERGATASEMSRWAMVRLLEAEPRPSLEEVREYVAEIDSEVAANGGPKAAPVETGNRDLTHDGLALALGDHWRNRARYCAPLRQWLFFDGPIWKADNTLRHMTETRRFLREMAEELSYEHEQAAKALRKADTVAKVVGLARSNPAQVATVEQWDSDPMLVGTPGGTLDLQTGELRPARPEDHITKMTAVTPAPPGTPAPLWTRVLARITGDNEALQAYLQRFAGYGLTGLIREHAFAFAHGPGANGKTLTINTMAGMFGDYAATIPTEMLMVSHNDRHPEELARLRGVRLAVGSETEEGTRWAEAKIKRLTGGDRIPARFMRQNTFEFSPQFKLIIVGNKRPSLRGVDEAMRRRLHLVPFTVTIPEEERDEALPEKLRAEWPAILRWAVDGCLAWQREGLNPPDVVRAATQDYLEAEDALTLWMEDCAALAADAWEASGSLFASWKRWADTRGEYIGSQKRFSAILQERGFEPRREAGTGLRGFRGLRLKPVEEPGRWEP